MHIKKLIWPDTNGEFPKIARLYCQIWKEPPWNEDFWTEEVVINDLEEQSKKPGAIILAAQNGNAEIIGFTWGYKTDVEGLSGISGLPQKIWKEVIGQSVPFYIDELGVDIGSRGKGIGTALVEELLKTVLTNGIKCVLLRTDIKAIPARKVYEKIGFRELPIIDADYKSRTYWIKE